MIKHNEPKIEVRHSAILIHDYKMGDAPELERFFKKWDPLTHSNKILGMYYDEESSTLYLPRGIDIWFIEKTFGVKATINTKPYQYSKTNKDVRLSTLPRDNDQKTALKFLLGKQEYSVTKEHSQLFINLPTGKGKSYCSIAACSYIGSKFCVITYSTDCLLQWRNYILQYTNIPDSNICMIKGSGIIHRINQIGSDKYDVFLISHDTIKSYATQFGWDAVYTLFEKLKIEVKIIDEAHKNFSNTIMIDFYTNVKRTFYVTATKARSDQSENQIFQLYFKNVLAIDLFDENKDPHTVYKALLYNSKPTPTIISKCKNAYGLNRNAYMNYITNNEEFYKMLCLVIDMSLSHNAKTLIYIGINDGIMRVKEWMETQFPILRGNIGVYTTLTPKERKQDELDKLIILSTMKSCAEAMDIKGLKITVVAAEPFKSEVMAIQSLGRTRDNNTLYIEFVDIGFYYTKYYYHCKKSIFRKYALESHQIVVNDTELEQQAIDIIMKYRRRPEPVITYQQMVVPVYPEMVVPVQYQQMVVEI